MPAPLAALSPLDGRYARTVDPLRAYFSEQALIRYRVRIELAWLQALAANPAIKELKPFSKKSAADLKACSAVKESGYFWDSRMKQMRLRTRSFS